MEHTDRRTLLLVATSSEWRPGCRSNDHVGDSASEFLVIAPRSELQDAVDMQGGSRRAQGPRNRRGFTGQNDRTASSIASPAGHDESPRDELVDRAISHVQGQQSPTARRNLSTVRESSRRQSPVRWAGSVVIFPRSRKRHDAFARIRVGHFKHG